MNTRFGYIPVASSLVPPQELDRLVGPYAPGLQALAGARLSENDLDFEGPVLYFVGSGGTEGTILALRGRRARFAPREPVTLLAHPGNNSLPASLEVLARLQQDGERGRILYLSGKDDQPGWASLRAWLDDLSVFHELSDLRIGLAGDPSDWLVASTPDPELVRRAWGPQVVPIPLEELADAIQRVPRKAAGPGLHALTERADEVCEPSEAELEDGVRSYLALADLAETYGLDAVTVRCFDLIKQLKTTGCFALAELSDRGVIAGCEGDLVSTVGLLWAHRLLGQTPWMANPSRFDPARNTLWLAHCTVPRGLVQGYALRSHFESGLGVGIQGWFAPGPVTIFRIGGKALEQLWVAEGQILQPGDDETLCRTQVEIELGGSASVSDLLARPLGNHVVLVLGRHAGRLRGWWRNLISGGG